MLVGATIANVDHVPALAGLIRRNCVDAEAVDPIVLADLLSLLPSQCGSDGVLYRRQASAIAAAGRYEHAATSLRPRARLHWQVVPDGHGWRWWSVLLLADIARDAAVSAPADDP
jgi:hypothetical protein